MSTDVRNGFKEAARFFVDTVAGVPDDGGTSPAWAAGRFARSLPTPPIHSKLSVATTVPRGRLSGWSSLTPPISI